MNSNKVIESALIGSVLGIRSRIDQALDKSEIWKYQMGGTPSYQGNCVIVDVEEPANDYVWLSFFRSPWHDYHYRIKVEFYDMSGLLDIMVVDVDVDGWRISVIPDYSFGTMNIMDVAPVPNDSSFIFYPIDDLGTVISAMAHIHEGEQLQNELLATAQAGQQAELERQQRRKAFTVIDGNKG